MADQSGANPRPKLEHHKPCNCKNSRCLKLYCECFAAGRHCADCHCTNCFNNLEHNEERKAAVEAVLSRNPDAFRPKIQDASVHNIAGAPRHNKGCNCKKSGCLKNYCECFQAGILCGDMCKCHSCKNFEGCAELQAARMGKASRSSSAPVMARVHSARAEVPQRTVLQAVVAQRGHAPEDVAAALCSAALQHSGDEQGLTEMQEYAVLTQLQQALGDLCTRAEGAS